MFWRVRNLAEEAQQSLVRASLEYIVQLFLQGDTHVVNLGGLPLMAVLLPCASSRFGLRLDHI